MSTATVTARQRAKRAVASVQPRTNKTGETIAWRLRWRIPEHLQASVGSKWGNVTFDLDELSKAKEWKRIFDELGAERAMALYKAEQDLEQPAAPVVQAVTVTLSGGEVAAGVTAQTGRTIRDIVTAYLEAGGKEGIAEPGYVKKSLAEAERHIFKVVVEVDERESGGKRYKIKLGDLPAEKLTRDVVKAWIDVLATTRAYRKTTFLSGKTIKNRHGLLSAAMSWAVTEKSWLPKNVAYGVKTPRTIKIPHVYVSPEQLFLILATLDKRFRDFIIVLVGTGMRWSEATALEVQDVTFTTEGGVSVQVFKAWKDDREGPQRIGTTKSSKGVRTIPLQAGDVAVEALRRACAGKKASDRVFTSPEGAQLRNAEFHDAFWGPMRVKLLPTWNGRFPRIHDLRHTFASVLIRRGTDIVTVSQLLGHEKPSFTYDTYVDCIPGSKEEGMEQMNDWLAAAITPPVTIEGKYSLDEELAEED